MLWQGAPCSETFFTVRISQSNKSAGQHALWWKYLAGVAISMFGSISYSYIKLHWRTIPDLTLESLIWLDSLLLISKPTSWTQSFTNLSVIFFAVLPSKNGFSMEAYLVAIFIYEILKVCICRLVNSIFFIYKWSFFGF